MTDDRSSYQSMSTMHRRTFFGTLVAMAVAAALPLPRGIEAATMPADDNAYWTASMFVKKADGNKLACAEGYNVIDAGDGWERHWCNVTKDGVVINTKDGSVPGND